MNSFRLSGIAIAAGGVSLIFINTILTPMLATDVPFPEMMASSTYLWRLSLAALTVFLFMIGSHGLHAYQRSRSGLFGIITFCLTFAGCAFLFAHEWAQVFFVHSIAVAAPDALQAMEDVEGLNAFDIEAMLAIVTFTLGWISFAISMLLAKVFTRLGPCLIIAGFFAIPLLSAAISPTWGGALGNAVLGAGFILLGRELFKSPLADSASSIPVDPDV
jgi:hypothetical protein